VEITDTMQRGHIALPNGLGLDFPTPDGAVVAGVAPNELTSSADRDPIAGTPWHKSVEARLEPVA
jgi:anaerobic selenocysteine-containing dehydrogenase